MKQQQAQRRKRGTRDMRHTGSAPRPTGPLISRDALKARSGIAEDVLTYSLQTYLLHNAERLPGGKRRPSGAGASAAYGFRAGLIDPASIIQQTLGAHGSYDQAALRLLVNRTPGPSAVWVQRALIRYVSHTFGWDVSARTLRRIASEERNSAERVADRIARMPVKGEDARQFAGTRDTTKAIAVYKQAGYHAVRYLAGIPSPDDPGALSNVSVPSLCDLIAAAPPERIWKAYHAASWLVRLQGHKINEVLRQVPSIKQLTDTQLVECLLPFPGLFPRTRLADATLPLFMVWLLMEPSLDLMLQLALLLGMVKREDAALAESKVSDAPVWAIDSFPANPDVGLPTVFLPSPMNEWSVTTQ